MPSRSGFSPAERSADMVTLTRQELRWICGHIESERDTSKNLKDRPGQKFAELHALNYENMAELAEKLQAIINSDDMRIRVK
jgi:hypothetical protein